MKTNYYHSLTIVGGSGFIGKSIIDSFNNKLLQKHRINKLNIICRKKFKIKEKLNLKKIKIFYKDVGKTKKIPKSDYYIYAAESTNISDYKKNNITKTHLKSIKNFSHIIIMQKFSILVQDQLIILSPKKLAMDIKIYIQN